MCITDDVSCDYGYYGNPIVTVLCLGSNSVLSVTSWQQWSLLLPPSLPFLKSLAVMAVCYYNIVSHIKFNLSELPVVICGLTKYGQSSVNNLTLWVMADVLTHQVYVTSFYPSSKYVVWRTHIVRSREQVSFIQSCVSFECVFTHNYLCTQAYKHIVCNNWSDAFLIMWPTHAHRSNLVPLLTCPQLIQKGSAECLNLGGWEVLWYDLVCWWSHCIEAHLPTDQLVELPSTVIPPVLCIIGNMVTPLSTPTHPHTHTYPPTPTHTHTHTTHHTPHTTHCTPHTHTHTQDFERSKAFLFLEEIKRRWSIHWCVYCAADISTNSSECWPLLCLPPDFRKHTETVFILLCHTQWTASFQEYLQRKWCVD